MKKFEYLIKPQIDAQDLSCLTDDKLNSLGEAGWELVTFFYKREKAPPLYVISTLSGKRFVAYEIGGTYLTKSLAKAYKWDDRSEAERAAEYNSFGVKVKVIEHP